MPVRAIPCNYRSVTGWVPVPGQRSVAFESTLERDFVLLSQFTPDFLVRWEDPRRAELVVSHRMV